MSEPDKVRVAAVADIHIHENDSGEHRELLTDISRRADILVLSGDLTNRGLTREAEALVSELQSFCSIPVVAVLGNHDYECGRHEEVKKIFCRAGIHMLDVEPVELMGVGFAGVKGFCGGFEQRMLAPWGEDVIKRFVQEAVDETLRLESDLARLRARHKVAVLHYSPIRRTVEGEPPEIFAFLGSSRLAEPLDRFQVDVAFHGHAHRGTHEGQTLGGIPVYNVALPLMKETSPDRPYKLCEFDNQAGMGLRSDV